MAFGIGESSTHYFIDNRIDLPRFQRKATWNEKDNFKLCISVFKGYPIGVVIVNEINKEGKKYLLDGRQRRNALTIMYENPVSVYNWASKFIGFKKTISDDEVRSKFSEKISEYLQSEFDKSTEDDDVINNSIDDVNEGNLPTFDPETQGENIHLLLDLILMVHNTFNGSNKFEGMFKFKNILDIKDLEYSVYKNGDIIIDPVKLKRFVENRIKEKETDLESFESYLIKRYKIDDQKSISKLDTYLHDHWDYFEKCFKTIEKANETIINAKIGLIRLTDASPLDAQNIFSLVNGGGAKLTAEELLSSRPYWNVELIDPTQEVKDEARKTYEFLGIAVPSNVVRWDVCATMLSRIDKNHLIFDEFDLTDSKTKDKLFTRKLTLGFKLVSAIKVGGISSNSVKELENERRVNIDWNVDIDKLVNELNQIIDLLIDVDYFKFMMQWKQSIMSLMGNSVALEFISLVYKNWKDLGEPTKSNSKSKEFKKNAVILCDRLIFEYSSRLWTGSGDSRLANDLKNHSERFKPVTVAEWHSVIDKFAEGLNSSVDKAIIYHYTCLKKMHPSFDGADTNARYEIDHIMAQNLFNNAVTVDKTLKDSLGNKAPLPKLDNISKSDYKLSELRAMTGLKWVYDETLRVSGIKENDVDKYSDVENIKLLIEERIEDYKETFKVARNNLFNN